MLSSQSLMRGWVGMRKLVFGSWAERRRDEASGKRVLMKMLHIWAAWVWVKARRWVDVWVRASKWDEDGRWEMIVRRISGGMVVREDILISEE
jgi:hypothetical protein